MAFEMFQSVVTADELHLPLRKTLPKSFDLFQYKNQIDDNYYYHYCIIAGWSGGRGKGRWEEEEELMKMSKWRKPKFHGHATVSTK